eukprot:7179060-Prymnesium_polylepis.1
MKVHRPAVTSETIQNTIGCNSARSGAPRGRAPEFIRSPLGAAPATTTRVFKPTFVTFILLPYCGHNACNTTSQTAPGAHAHSEPRRAQRGTDGHVAEDRRKT